MRLRPLLLLLPLLACEVTVPQGPDLNPVPELASVEPAVLLTGEVSREVQLLGGGFVDGAVVLVDGVERSAAVVGDGELRLSLGATDLGTPRSVALRVRNPSPGGGQSGALQLRIEHPAPRVDSLSAPGVAPPYPDPLELRVYGAGFRPPPTGSAVLWNGTVVPATVLSDSEVGFTVPRYLLGVPGNASVAVVNPGPGGGRSGDVPFGVASPPPVVDRVHPDTLLLDGSSVTLRIAGSGFSPFTRVLYDGAELESIPVAVDTLEAELPGHLVVRGGGELTVVNPAPGGGSDLVQIFLEELRPRISQVDPGQLLQGLPSATVTLQGWSFAPDATVLLDGLLRDADVLTDQTIRLALDADDLAEPMGFEVQVVNPRGGGASEAQPLSVVPDRELLIRTAGGYQVHSLLGTPGLAFPSVRDVGGLDHSPTAGLILYDQVFYVPEGWYRRLMVVPDTGGTPRRFIPPGPDSLGIHEANGRFSSDGEIVYFQAEGRIWRVQSDGSNPEPLTTPAGWTEHEFPAPSAAGDRLTYSVTSGATGLLHILDLNTLQSTSLGVEGLLSLWSPDDQWIYYRDTYGALRRIRPDGTVDDTFSVPGSRIDFDLTSDGRFLFTRIPTEYGPSVAALVDTATGEVIRLDIQEESLYRNTIWYER